MHACCVMLIASRRDVQTIKKKKQWQTCVTKTKTVSCKVERFTTSTRNMCKVIVIDECCWGNIPLVNVVTWT